MRRFIPIPDSDRPRAALNQNFKCWGTMRADYINGRQHTEKCGNPITSDSAWLAGHGLICGNCAKDQPEDERSYPEKMKT
jgi:hypothetical protein